MIKLGQMDLKGINWVQNTKIRSYGLERSQLAIQLSCPDLIFDYAIVVSKIVFKFG